MDGEQGWTWLHRIFWGTFLVLAAAGITFGIWNVIYVLISR